VGTLTANSRSVAKKSSQRRVPAPVSSVRNQQALRGQRQVQHPEGIFVCPPLTFPARSATNSAPSKTAVAYTRGAGSAKTGERDFQTMLRQEALSGQLVDRVMLSRRRYVGSIPHL
jgi:hypothetical protein